MSRFERYHKPVLGVRYDRHSNFGGKWYFAGGKKSKPEQYEVEMTAKGFRCDCPGFRFRGKCKHVEMVGTAIDVIVS